MRPITEIIVHCSATPEGRRFTADDIDKWHRARGFTGIGYHYVILLDGTIQEGRPLDAPGAHCLGHNSNSIGICYIGGLDSHGKKAKDTRTLPQSDALATLLKRLHNQFPHATLHGHCEFAAKACPSFNVHELDYIFR